MAKTVVILGGSYAGLHVAHYILKNEKDAKVILVSKDKNSHFFWNIATVRAIVPGTINDEQILEPLEKALKRYPQDKWELVIGAAEHVDADAKTVKVGARTLSYDQLVVATGARYSAVDVPWKNNGTYKETTALMHKTREQVAAAKHIVVAGAGSTGVEVAGELGFAYGKEKEVVLLCADAKLLSGDSIAGNAKTELKKLNVSVKYNARVKGTSASPDGKTEVTLENGERISTDLYLPTMGLMPNSEMLDAKFLNEKNNVVVDEFFKVKGAQDVWAAGDIVSVPRAGFMITQKQAAGVGKNVVAALSGKQPTPVKGMPMDIFAVATGPSRGVGRMGSIKMFSVMVWMAKGRTLAVQMLPSYIDGSVA